MKKIPITDLPQHIPQGWELEDGRKLDWWRFERLHIHYPPEPYRLLYYSRGLARLFHEEDQFQGATLWLTDWGVWDANVEAIGFEVIRKLCGASFDPQREALQFDGTEFLSAVASLFQPILVGWDAYFVPRWRNADSLFYLRVSHDEYIDVVCRDAETAARGRQELAQWKIEVSDHEPAPD
jgi:hypothetical protein